MKNSSTDTSMLPEVWLRPWNEDDLTLLHSMNTEELWLHLGGPETTSGVLKRHKRYLESVPGKTQMFVIMHGEHSSGSIGYWTRQWHGDDIFEIGWFVLPDCQGRGIATRGTSALLRLLSSLKPQAVVHAFPSIDNPASNAICRKLGFSFLGDTEFEFPPGSWMKCNDWRLSLTD